MFSSIAVADVISFPSFRPAVAATVGRVAVHARISVQSHEGRASRPETFKSGRIDRDRASGK